MANVNGNNNGFAEAATKWFENLDWGKVKTGAMVGGFVLTAISAFAAGKIQEKQINEATAKNVEAYITKLANGANSHHEITK